MLRRGWIVVVLLGMLLAVPGRAERVEKPMSDTDIVARVNGTPIHRKAVREVVQGALEMQDAPPDPSRVSKLAQDALDSLIDLELLYQESQTRGIKITDATVEAEIARTRDHFADQHTFEAALKERGMTPTDLERDTRKTLAVTQLLESTVWKNLTITPAQIQDFYAHNKEEFKHPAQIRASHILIRVPDDATAAESLAAKQQATQLLERLKAGADFAQLARERSQDPGSASKGGDLGYFAKGDMVDAFEKPAFKLAPGQLSDVITTQYGYHIIKVTERRAAGYQPVSEVEDRIRAVLTKSAQQQAQSDLEAELRKKAKIEFLDPTTK